jgi:glycosyltransferase involved in cell wall biosynthesis
MNSEPLISILVPSYNQAAFIENTILSVLKQTYAHWELIIQDGASTDQTAAICLKYVKSDQRIQFYTEPDSGFADAVNKALDKSTGSICSIQSSDDVYAHAEVFREVVQLFQSHPKAQLVYGNAEAVTASFALLPDTKEPHTNIITAVDPLGVFHLTPSLPQSSTFFKKQRALVVGKLNSEVDMVADTDFWTRIATASPCLLDNQIFHADTGWSYVTIHPGQRSAMQYRFYMGRVKMALSQLADVRIDVAAAIKKQRSIGLIHDALEYFCSKGLDCQELSHLLTELTHHPLSLKRRMKIFLSRYSLFRKLIPYHCESDNLSELAHSAALKPISKWFI